MPKASHQSGTRKGKRNGTKVEKNVRMSYGEIKAIIMIVLRLVIMAVLAAKPLSLY